MTPVPEQQQLFTRLLRLTLLRGIVIGLFGVVTGMWVYNFIQRFFFLEPVPFFFEGPLGPLPMILCGAQFVLQAEGIRLRSQCLALAQRGNSDLFSKHFLRLMGSFFLIAGVVLLISKPFGLPNPTLPDTQQTTVAFAIGLAFFAVFLIIGGISWYLSRRERRSAGP